jgi:hypothetical protein
MLLLASLVGMTIRVARLLLFTTYGKLVGYVASQNEISLQHFISFAVSGMPQVERTQKMMSLLDVSQDMQQEDKHPQQDNERKMRYFVGIEVCKVGMPLRDLLKPETKPTKAPRKAKQMDGENESPRNQQKCVQIGR